MKSIFTFLMTLCINSLVFSQSTADFENYEIDIDTFINNSQSDGVFRSGNVIIPNDYNAEWASWSGWAISSKIDTIDGTYLNDLSVINGSGVEASQNYAVNFDNSYIRIDDGPAYVENISINNSTYVFKTIKDGNAFAKRFGGENGDDPDYFRVNFIGILDGNAKTDTVTVYLADYRNADNNEDYIINTWTEVNLESLGLVDEIRFTYESSDLGQFGINTPKYMCVDNIVTTQSVNNTNVLDDIHFYPNPTQDYIYFQKRIEADYYIFNIDGSQLRSGSIEHNSLNIQDLPSGKYLLAIDFGNMQPTVKEFVKL